MNLKLAFRSLLNRKQNNIIKIVSLGVGLSIGLVLLSKVILDESYDSFYPNNNRVYKVEYKSVDDKTFEGLSGGVIPDLKNEIPEIESATRLQRFFLDKSTNFEYKNKEYSASKGFTYADNHLFEILPRTMIVGNAKDILSKPMNVLVSKSVADKLGGNIVGETIILDKLELTVGGIFEDIPYNSHAKYDIIISITSLKDKDILTNWNCCQWFSGYVKLNPNVKYKDVEKLMSEYFRTRKADEKGSLYMIPLDKIHSENSEIKKMTSLLAAIAIVLLSTGILNYVLISTTNILKRSKSIAIYKTYGAQTQDIIKQSFSTTIIDLFLSLFLALLIILSFRTTIETLLSTPISGLFISSNIVWLVAICVIVFLVLGFSPAYLSAKIPTNTIFKNLKTSSNWKFILFAQFLITAFILAFLLIVTKQYDMMKNYNLGYNSENITFTNINSVEKDSRYKLMKAIEDLPEVKMVATNSEMHLGNMSGSILHLENNEKISVIDFYSTNENFYKILELPIIEGTGFNTESVDNDLLISDRLANNLKTLNSWDNVINKSVKLGSALFRIVGVYSEIKIRSLEIDDPRPSVMPYSRNWGFITHLNIKFHDMTAENMNKVQAVFDRMEPDKNLKLNTYTDKLSSLYEKSRLFRNSVMVGALITFILGIIALIAYTNNQINNKQKEIAIRKVNGAKFIEILKLFLTKTYLMAIPAIVLGVFAAKIAADKWMENFSEKTDTTTTLLFSSVILIVIIGVVILLSCFKISKQNPIKYLMSE